MFEEFFSLLHEAQVLNTFLMCPTAPSGPSYCFDLRGKRGSESKARRPEFLSSQFGNPITRMGCHKIHHRHHHIPSRI
jgi:hypothetical protein